MRRIGAFLGLLGGVVAVVSVANGFAAIGDDPLYQSRSAFGVAALALGVLAGIVGFWPRISPAVAAALMVGAGLVGFLITLVWYINTLYVVALPFWIVGAALLLTQAFRLRRA